MGLLSVIRKQKLRDRQVRVLVLGLDNAGKTTIVKQLLGEDLSEVSPTVGFAIHTHERRGFLLDIWDVGGQKSLRPFWQNYFEKTDALVWVVDATALGRLDELRRELHATLAESRLLGASLLVFVNKVDAVAPAAAAAVEAQVRELLALDALRQHHVRLLRSSARTGEGVAAGFDWVVDEAQERLYPTAPAEAIDPPQST